MTDDIQRYSAHIDYCYIEPMVSVEPESDGAFVYYDEIEKMIKEAAHVKKVLALLAAPTPRILEAGANAVISPYATAVRLAEHALATMLAEANKEATEAQEVKGE